MFQIVSDNDHESRVLIGQDKLQFHPSPTSVCVGLEVSLICIP